MTDEARKLAKRLCLFFREDASGSGILFALEDAMVDPIAAALSAAREEGRREGLEDAARVVERRAGNGYGVSAEELIACGAILRELALPPPEAPR